MTYFYYCYDFHGTSNLNEKKASREESGSPVEELLLFN